MIFKLFFIILIILNFKLFVLTQEFKSLGKCVNIDLNNPCYKTLNYTSFYLENNESIDQLYSNITTVYGYLDLTTPDCKSNATLLFCFKYFPKCTTFNETLNNGTTIISIDLPSLPCNSFCMNTQIPCQFYIDNYFKEMSCDYKFSNGLLAFPNNSTSFSILNGSIELNTQCIGKESLNEINDNVTIDCPKPLLNAKDYVIKGKKNYYYVTDECILDCPFSIYPKEKQRMLNITNYIFTTVSFITCTFMILTFGVIPNKITNRMESILAFSIGGWLAAFQLYLQNTQSNFDCSNDRGRLKSQSDYLCLFNGIIFHLGALTAITWGPMIAYDFYRTSLMKKINKFYIYRIVMGGLIIVLTAIPAFAGDYGASVGTSGCWIASSSFQYISFYVPSWISMGFLFLFSILSVINISKMYYQTPNTRILFFNIKIIITILLLLFVLTFASSFKFYMQGHESDITSSIGEWMTCITINKSNPSTCELKLPGYDLRALNIWVISILGFTIFLGYGLDPIVIKIWKESNKFNWLINKFGLSNFIHLGSTSSSSSSNSLKKTTTKSTNSQTKTTTTNISSLDNNKN